MVSPFAAWAKHAHSAVASQSCPHSCTVSRQLALKFHGCGLLPLASRQKPTPRATDRAVAGGGSGGGRVGGEGGGEGSGAHGLGGGGGEGRGLGEGGGDGGGDGIKNIALLEPSPVAVMPSLQRAESLISKASLVGRFRRLGGDGAEADCLPVGQGDLEGNVELPTEVIVGATEGGIRHTPCVGHARRLSRWGEVQELEGLGPLTCAASGLPITYRFAGQDDLERGVGLEDGQDAVLFLIFGQVLHTHLEGHCVVDLDGPCIDSRARPSPARFDGRDECR
eukprot:scaffold92866_cov54-Phaeocystis_antarctica.AAC.1